MPGTASIGGHASKPRFPSDYGPTRWARSMSWLLKTVLAHPGSLCLWDFMSHLDPKSRCAGYPVDRRSGDLGRWLRQARTCLDENAAHERYSGGVTGFRRPRCPSRHFWFPLVSGTELTPSSQTAANSPRIERQLNAVRHRGRTCRRDDPESTGVQPLQKDEHSQEQGHTAPRANGSPAKKSWLIRAALAAGHAARIAAGGHRAAPRRESVSVPAAA